jgi:hypothetical protein
MKQKIFWLPVVSAAVAAALTMSGCTKSSSTSPNPVASQEKAAQLAKDGKHKESADEYARLGELLMMPEGFQYADKMFGLALIEDPNNAKANIYKSVTEPMMTAKGYIPKVERLITAEDDQKAMERLRNNISALHMPELQQFSEDLPQGDQPFESYYDVQRFAREKLLPAVLKAVDYLNHVDATQPIQLNFTPTRALLDPVRHEGSYYSSWSNCYNDPSTGYKCDSGGYQDSYSDAKLPNIYHVDQHDIKIMKSAMMAIADQIRLSTAFAFKDIEFAMRRLKALDQIRREAGAPGVSAQDVVEVLRHYNRLFTLESDNQLSEIAKSTSQVLRNGIELANLKSTLCDSTDRTADNSLIRPICIEASMVDSLQTGLDLLAGPKEIKLGDDENGSINVVMDINAILNHPPQDLKALLPNSFDQAGNPTSYPDATMGGLFPNGDIISKLKLVGATDRIQTATDAANSSLRKVHSHL